MCYANFLQINNNLGQSVFYCFYRRSSVATYAMQNRQTQRREILPASERDKQGHAQKRRHRQTIPVMIHRAYNYYQS